MKASHWLTGIPTALAVTASLICGTTSATAESAADFYRGKTVKFIVGTAAGGGFSTYGLFLASHIGRHIPGNPNVVVEHMPGTGGIKSLNYVASAAALDGSVFAVAMPNFWVTPYVSPKAVKFDPKKFRFIGRVSDFGRVLAVWHTTGVRSIDDLKKKTLTVGASSKRSTTSVAPTLINELLGTKLKVVTGYRGTGPTLVAMERKEVDATTVASATLIGTRGHWLRDKKIIVLAGLDFAEVPGAPRIRDLIKDEKQRALWDFVALPALFGTASVVAPGVPADRLAALRQGFNATVKDPAFIADAKKRNLPINPQSGEELDAFHAKHSSPSPEIIAHVARVMGVKTK